RIGIPLGISATFAWFDRPVSFTQAGRSIKVETVNSSPAPFGKNSANFLRTPKTAKSFETAEKVLSHTSARICFGPVRRLWRACLGRLPLPEARLSNEKIRRRLCCLLSQPPLRARQPLGAHRGRSERTDHAFNVHDQGSQ